MNYGKLDALIAIKVMGYHLRETLDGKLWEECLDGHWWALGYQDSPEECGMQFSTDLNSAFEVLEKAAYPKGFEYCMRIHHDWQIQDEPYHAKIDKACASAETMPLAMCLCALRAVGVTEAEISEAMA